MNISVYNMESPQARNQLTMVDRNDLNVVKDFPCVARVFIQEARFRERWKPNGEFHEPYLEILGEVSSFFTEDNGIREYAGNFPCGTDEVSIAKFFEDEAGIPVSIMYLLTDEELGKLYAKGLRRRGFRPPAIMKNNMMEIPVKVNFVAIYDTPLCYIEIVNRTALTTSTYENAYTDLLDMCEVHPETLKQRQANGYIYVSENEYGLMQAADSLGDEYYSQPEQSETEQQQTAEAPLTAEEKGLAAIKEQFNEILKENAEQRENLAQIRENNTVFDPSAMLKTVRDNAEAAVQQQYTEHDVYGRVVTNGADVANGKIDYFKIKEQSKVEQARQEHLVRQNDIAADNKALNEGNTDIAGQGAGETAVYEEHLRKKKEEKDELQRNRAADIAADNKALNAGITDVAGQGAAEKPVPSSQSLIANLFNRNKQQNTQRQVDLNIQQTPAPANPNQQQFL